MLPPQTTSLKSGIQKEAPATFNKISALAVSQGMDFFQQALSPSKKMASVVW
jgi:hypothetical protein